MKYELKTNRGLRMEFESDSFNTEEYVAVLNDESVFSIAVGNMVTQKNNVQSIEPVYTAETTPTEQQIAIHTNQGDVITAYSDTYNAQEVSKSLNDRAKQFILLGGVIVHKHNANLILPAQ